MDDETKKSTLKTIIEDWVVPKNRTSRQRKAILKEKLK